MIRLFTVAIFFLLAVFSPLVIPAANGQRLLERIRKNLEDNRPDGKLLRRLFSDDDDDKEKDSERDSKDKQPRRSAKKGTGDREPTLASVENHPSELGVVFRRAKEGKGLIVTQLDRRQAGYVAGLRKGDRVLSLGKIPTNSNADIQGVLDILSPGDELALELIRQGRKDQIVVQLGNKPTQGLTPPSTAPGDPVRRGDGLPPSHSTGHSVLGLGNQNPPSSENRRDGVNSWIVDPPSLGSRDGRVGRSTTGINQQKLSNDVRLLQEQLREQQRTIELLKAKLEAQELLNDPGMADEDWNDLKGSTVPTMKPFPSVKIPSPNNLSNSIDLELEFDPPK